MKKVLIVGGKNTCRSIVACECLKKILQDKGETGVSVDMAGIMAFPDIPAEAEAVEALKGAGITGDFKSKPLSKKAKASAKAMAKAAGRPYPNLVDNMRAARKKK